MTAGDGGEDDTDGMSFEERRERVRELYEKHAEVDL